MRHSSKCLSPSITLLAGLYRVVEHDGVKFPHFMIRSQYTAPNIMFIHNKMSIIFDSSDVALLRDWLNPEATLPWDVERIIENSIMEMVYEKDLYSAREAGSQGYDVRLLLALWTVAVLMNCTVCRGLDHDVLDRMIKKRFLKLEYVCVYESAA